MFGKKDPDAEAGSLQQSIHKANQIGVENTGILTLLAQDYLKDKRSRRRWGTFFKVLVLLYLFGLLLAFFKTSDSAVSEPHTALVELSGPIGPQSVNSDVINHSLQRAFESNFAKGIVLRLNSPGGTPVQAAEINAEIIRLRALYPEKPVYAVISDLCASGCYYVAVAANEIYAHPSSLVGSIGVRMGSFGFVETMRKLGVERRLITAGDNKGMLDPFSPVDQSVEQHTRSMLAEVHQQFIDAVTKGRGDRLDTSADLFSGLVWSGERAESLGLIDQFGSLDEVARNVIKQKRVIDYTSRGTWWDRVADRLGASISAALQTSFRNQLVLAE